MDRYERYVLRQLAHAALFGSEPQAPARPKRPNRALAGWLCTHAETLGLPEPEDIDPDRVESLMGRVDRDTWAAMAPLVQALAKPQRCPPPSSLDKRLSWLCATLSLTPQEDTVLRLAVRAALSRPVHALAEAVEDGSSGRNEINRSTIGALTGLGASQLRRLLAPSGALRLLGLLEDRKGDDYAPSRTVLRVARLSTSDPDRLRAALVGEAKGLELEWRDFDHLGPVRELAERLLRGALGSHEAGVNILLHGAPGTGKTEFVRVLAERLGSHALFVGEADEEDGEPLRSARIAAFALLRALAGRAGRTLLVVDEADDVFTGVDEDDAEARTGSKVFMNRLVERTQAPTVWITNHPGRLGPAVLRRMALAIRFPEPGQGVRRRVVERAAARRRLRLPADTLDRLSLVPATPAVIDMALRVAGLAGGVVADDAALSARSVLDAMGEARPEQALPAGFAFDPALSAADQDLDQLAAQVAASGERAVSFCLYGLPGTGKSAFAHHLASRLGLDVVEKRASDLLSMWVGETEKGIASAFREAADRRAMLILDEADSLLRDRAGARAGWEVTQVNEMLTWMERHPYPFACTTNLMDSLDPATLRRFLFKVRFLPLNPDQVRALFQRAFGQEAPAAVAALTPLTPGDFAVVTRKAKVLGERDAGALARLLVAEVAAKPGKGLGRIGFTAEVIE